MCNCHSYNMQIGSEPEEVLKVADYFHFEQMDGKRHISVDSCIAPVIKALWRAGIGTLNCCCGHNIDNPSIIFPEHITPAEIHKAKTIINKLDGREFSLKAWRLVDL